MSSAISLKGLDGSNPLAFLALLGVSLLIRPFCSQLRIGWHQEGGAWRPQVLNFMGSEDDLVRYLFTSLASTPSAPFEISKELPFSREILHTAMLKSQQEITQRDRRSADLLAGFGSDVHGDEDGMFLDTSLRMVRYRDASLQGLPAYALAIRKKTSELDIRAALFSSWQYMDEGFSLRWDPVEDQRYALRWYDPKIKSNRKFGPRTMRGANALALEALALVPVQPHLRGVNTTAFVESKEGAIDFVWPIWGPPISVETIRSLLTLADLMREPLPRSDLEARGVVEVYRCARIAQNRYYKNFAPSRPA